MSRSPKTRRSNEHNEACNLCFRLEDINHWIMLPSCLSFVAALCVLLPEGAAFVTPINAATAVSRSASRPSSSSRVPALKMGEEAATEGEPAGPTAADISKGIAHPEAVFTVPENILKVLPHRYPFALVDKVLHFEAGKRIIGIKCITNNEPQFTGHFPDLPIMPGVLQVCDIAALGIGAVGVLVWGHTCACMTAHNAPLERICPHVQYDAIGKYNP